jgi:hypothetical protein
MGSREWERIVTMAESAWNAGQRSLTAQIYAAADQPGFHRAYLRERCVALTGRPPPSQPHLTIVR